MCASVREWDRQLVWVGSSSKEHSIVNGKRHYAAFYVVCSYVCMCACVCAYMFVFCALRTHCTMKLATIPLTLCNFIIVFVPLLIISYLLTMHSAEQTLMMYDFLICLLFSCFTLAHFHLYFVAVPFRLCFCLCVCLCVCEAKSIT